MSAEMLNILTLSELEEMARQTQHQVYFRAIDIYEWWQLERDGPGLFSFSEETYFDRSISDEVLNRVKMKGTGIIIMHEDTPHYGPKRFEIASYRSGSDNRIKASYDPKKDTAISTFYKCQVDFIGEVLVCRAWHSWENAIY